MFKPTYSIVRDVSLGGRVLVRISVLKKIHLIYVVLDVRKLNNLCQVYTYFVLEAVLITVTTTLIPFKDSVKQIIGKQMYDIYYETHSLYYSKVLH